MEHAAHTLGAVINSHEDLALELLARPDQRFLDLERDLQKRSTLLIFAAQFGAAHMVRELLVQHDANLDARTDNGQSALCRAASQCQQAALNVLSEVYQARGRLQEALDRPCLQHKGAPYPLLHHLANKHLANNTLQLTVLRELVSRWGADVRIPIIGFGSTYMMLHVCAANGKLLLVKYLIEECSLYLSVDERALDGSHTPLSFLCKFCKREDEERILPVVRYLLAQGADITHRITPDHTLVQIALDTGKHMVHELLVSHEQMQRVEQIAQEVAARKAMMFAAKQREADEAAQALLAELAAEEALSAQNKAKKSKGGKESKKKKYGDRTGEPPQGESKEREMEEMGEGNSGKKDTRDEEREEKGGSIGQGQHGTCRTRRMVKRR